MGEEKSIDSIEEDTFYQKYINRKNKLLNGKVWVVDGKIIVIETSNSIPTVTINESFEEIIVLKNGEIVTEPTFKVTEKDEVTIDIEASETPPFCSITLDEKQLTAFIEIQPGYLISRKLQNLTPVHEAKLIIEEFKEVTKRLSVEEVRQKLREAGVTYGIDEDAIKLAVQSNKNVKIEVAKGIPAQEGKDGFLELKIESAIKRVLSADKKGTIDFRETRKIPTIEPGDVLAIIHPPQKGEKGRSVTDTDIEPKPVNAISFHSEKGTSLDENSIIATKTGRPYINQKDYLVKATVIPKFLQQENVSISTGNVRFYGDVEVVGEVEENMVVEAGNDIILHGSVNRSAITANHSIMCSGNISNSILSAGEKSATLLVLGKSIGVVAEQLEMLISVIGQITQSSNYVNSEQQQSVHSIVDFLLKKRFSDFKKVTKEYILTVDKNKDLLSIEWKVIAKKLQEAFFTHSHSETTTQQLRGVLLAIRDIQEKNVLDFEEDSSILVSSTLNSSLKCNGDVQVVGHGSLNTIIESQGKVTINGLLRGGNVFAKEGAEIRETGSSGGVRSSISVPAGKYIRIDRAYEGTELIIGSDKLILNSLQYNIFARLNADGKIMLK